MAKATQPPRIDGTLRINRDAAHSWVPWFVEHIAASGLGPDSGLVRFSKLVKSDFDGMANKPGLAFPMSKSFKETLTDFHRRVLGRDSLSPHMAVLACGWRGAGEPEDEVPHDELQRAKSDLEKPYVEVPFKPTEAVEEKQPANTLF